MKNLQTFEKFINIFKSKKKVVKEEPIVEMTQEDADLITDYFFEVEEKYGMVQYTKGNNNYFLNSGHFADIHDIRCGGNIMFFIQSMREQGFENMCRFAIFGGETALWRSLVEEINEDVEKFKKRIVDKYQFSESHITKEAGLSSITFYITKK